MKILPAGLSITSHQSRDMMGRIFRIRITDNISRCIACEVELSGAAFADALSNLAERPCVMEFNDSGVVGMKAEHKTEFIPCEKWIGHKEDVSAYLAPFEVDGWRGWESDMHNSHRRTDGGYTVSFHRHVPATPEDIEAAKKDH